MAGLAGIVAGFMRRKHVPPPVPVPPASVEEFVLTALALVPAAVGVNILVVALTPGMPSMNALTKGLLGLSVWLLYSSARVHGSLGPFWLGLGGGLVAFASLWLTPVLVYAGLAAIVAGSVWDFQRARAHRKPACTGG